MSDEMTAPTVAEIAGKLTKAQREALLDAWYGPRGWRIERRNDALCSLGLCVVGTSKPTNLGLAVRAHLQETDR